jgi:hypothetical protein
LHAVRPEARGSCLHATIVTHAQLDITLTQPRPPLPVQIRTQLLGLRVMGGYACIAAIYASANHQLNHTPNSIGCNT